MSNPKFHQCEGADGEFFHRWAVGKLNSMGRWCMNISNYMGGWCQRKLNSMGGWVKKSAVFHPQVFFSGIALSKLFECKIVYSRLSLTQLCITQYYLLSRLDGPVPVFSPIYYCNSTTFISTTAKSIKLITRYEKLVPLINFSVFYNA